MKIHAKKSLGQNFLIDHEALIDIASAIAIWEKHIIEVGPGYGALTDYLIQGNPISLDLVELDKEMVNILKKKYDLNGFQMTLHHQDILTFSPPYQTYSVIANIPYYITSPILFRFLYELPFAPESMVIMMQQEVGEKILEWRAKKPHHSLLSLAMELACEDIEIVRYVERLSFDPPPKVDSIVLKFISKKLRDSALEARLLKIWKTAFTHPRKTLLSNFKGSNYDLEIIQKWLTACWYDERVRAEAVKKEDWIPLAGLQ